MTNEKSLQVAQGLRILSLLIASGKLDARDISLMFVTDGGFREHLLMVADSISGTDGEENTCARLLDAIEMVSP